MRGKLVPGLSFEALLDSNVVNSMNKAKVQALLQSNTDMDDLQPAGAPAPDAYKSRGGSGARGHRGAR